MATLDDKILGEKLHYYCSSSEDEGEDGDEQGPSKGASSSAAGNCDPGSNAKFIPESDLRDWDGYSCNTGPKGVIKDWQRFKQLETEKRENQEAERLALMKKLSLTCQTQGEEAKQRTRGDPLDAEMDQLMTTSDPFFNEYVKKRMQEMLLAQDKIKVDKRVFGSLLELSTGTEFLEAIDKEKSHITVICHIYRRDIPACETMNGCLRCLAVDFNFVKFCSIEASSAGMSSHFETSGVPALLIYKNGNLLGNFIRVTDELGENFFANDVEGFLVDHGFLPDQSCVPEIVSKSIRLNTNEESDSDLE